jgi:hypothetical protein
VTLGALHAAVSAREWELRSPVVELRSFPLSSRVTSCTILGETASYVVGVFRPLEVTQMAADALSRSGAELLPSMALRTNHRRMGPRQREARRTMVKLRAAPLLRCVALCAVLGESSGGMIRATGLVEIALVARNTIR